MIRERLLLQKTTVPDFLPLSQRHSHTRVMPNAAAKKASKPSETRWVADEADDEDGDVVCFDADPLEELDEIGTGVPVATAPTPPVTGPLSEA